MARSQVSFLFVGGLYTNSKQMQETHKNVSVTYKLVPTHCLGTPGGTAVEV